MQDIVSLLLGCIFLGLAGYAGFETIHVYRSWQQAVNDTRKPTTDYRVRQRRHHACSFWTQVLLSMLLIVFILLMAASICFRSGV